MLSSLALLAVVLTFSLVRRARPRPAASPLDVGGLPSVLRCLPELPSDTATPVAALTVLLTTRRSLTKGDVVHIYASRRRTRLDIRSFLTGPTTQFGIIPPNVQKAVSLVALPSLGEATLAPSCVAFTFLQGRHNVPRATDDSDRWPFFKSSEINYVDCYRNPGRSSTGVDSNREDEHSGP